MPRARRPTRRICVEIYQTHARMKRLTDRALIALQGPMAEAALAARAAEIRTMAFMEVRAVTLMDEACMVSRSGYTGEDGFEISVPAKAAEVPLRSPAARSRGLHRSALERDSRLRAEVEVASACTAPTSMRRPTPIEASLTGRSQRPAARRRARGRLRWRHDDPWTDRERRRRRRVGLRPEGRCSSARRYAAFPRRTRHDGSGIVTSGGSA